MSLQALWEGQKKDGQVQIGKPPRLKPPRLAALDILAYPWGRLDYIRNLKKREGVPEMGTKPLKALRGYQASNRGSNNL